MPLYNTQTAIDQLSGATGIASWPAGAAAGDGVSLAEAVRYLEDALLGTSGVVTFPASAAPANGVSLAEVMREIFDQEEKAANKAAATMVNNQVMFTIAGGPIKIVDLISECITTNDGTASTLQYRSNPTVGSAATISGASGSLASVAAGATVRLAPTALSTAPVIALAAAGGVQLGTNVANFITVMPGTIQMVIGTGSTTGTWAHYLRYKPLTRGVTVV